MQLSIRSYAQQLCRKQRVRQRRKVNRTHQRYVQVSGRLRRLSRDMRVVYL